MDKLKKLLAEYDAVLEKYNPLALEHLLPALQKNEIKKFMSELGINDDSFFGLYSWRNGSELDHFYYLKGGGIITLKNILPYLNAQKEIVPSWNDNLIPIAEYNDDLLSFNKEKGKDYGKLYLYSVPLLFIEEPISYYDSIEAMIITNTEAYQQGILYYDEDEEFFEYDVREFAELATIHNPNSDYWKLRKTII